MVQDAMFDVAGLVTDDSAAEFGMQLGQAVLFGDGANKPTGILNTAPAATADTTPDTRTREAIRYLEGSGSPNLLDSDLLISTYFDLNPGYRRNAVWLMSSATLAYVRKLKDLQGRYLWNEGIAGTGENGSILGRRIVISERMASVGVGAGNVPILVGDFYRGYELVAIGNMLITVDANITSPGFIKWYLRQRWLGKLIDNNAIRAIRT